MPILVVCPNGHSLKVKASLAGRTGRCPVCRALVKVPHPPTENLSEDAIMSLLESPPPGGERKESSPKAPVPRAAEAKKSCSRCNREIPATTHICPYCHTYIAGLADFETGTG